MPPPPSSQGRHYQSQPGFSAGPAEHGQLSGSQGVHEPYSVAQSQHPSSYAPGPSSVPVSFAGSSTIRGAGLVSLRAAHWLRDVALEMAKDRRAS